MALTTSIVVGDTVMHELEDLPLELLPQLQSPQLVADLAERASATMLSAPWTCWIVDVNCDIKSNWRT